MTELQKLIQHRTSLLNVISQKREELRDLEDSLKGVNKEIETINEAKQPSLYFGDYCGEKRV